MLLSIFQNNICRAGNLLIRSSLIHWFAHRSFTHSLIAHSLICSFCSNQMSGCELFAQIAQDKWATVSESLRGNEQPWANRSGRSRQMSNHERFVMSLRGNKWISNSLKKIWLKKSKILFFSMFYKRCFYWKNERIAHFLFFGERCQ